MKLKSCYLAFAAALSLVVAAPASAVDLQLVKDASKIEFVGSKPDGKHKGGFKNFEVTAVADFEAAERSSLNIQIETKSLWSDDEKLTNHLKSPDFFNVRKHPTITFESTEIVPGEGDEETAHGTIKGSMNMLGKAVEVDVPIEVEMSEELIELTAKFEIDRTEWGMEYGQGKIDNKVKINVELTLKR